MEELDMKEVMDWGRENYPQFVGNVELIKSLYRRHKLGIKKRQNKSKKKIKIGRLVEIGDGDRRLVNIVVIEELVRKKTKKGDKFWQMLEIGDSSKVVRATYLSSSQEGLMKEGEMYLAEVSMKKSKYGEDYSVWSYEKLSREESIVVDLVFDYLIDLGKLKKDKLIKICEGKGVDMGRIIELIGLEEKGDYYVR